jgi:hypothetical protein
MSAALKARAARPALALAVALVLAGGLAGCGGSSHDPAAYTRGYNAGLVARHHFLSAQGPPGDLLYLCAQAEYVDIQRMANSVARFWADGFNLGCTNQSF